MGAAGGVSPGPLTTFALSRTFLFGRKAGYIAASVPLITDLPIVLASVYFVDFFYNYNLFPAYVSMFGGIFLLYLAYDTFKTDFAVDNSGIKDSTLVKGIVTNYLNPNPYLFWFSVGAPTIIGFGNDNFLQVILFLFFFYTGLVGTKILIVTAASKSIKFLNEKNLKKITRLLALILVIYALEYIYQSIIKFTI